MPDKYVDVCVPRLGGWVLALVCWGIVAAGILDSYLVVKLHLTLEDNKRLEQQVKEQAGWANTYNYEINKLQRSLHKCWKEQEEGTCGKGK